MRIVIIEKSSIHRVRKSFILASISMNYSNIGGGGKYNREIEGI